MGARKLMEEKITALMRALPDNELEGVLVYMESISAKKDEDVLQLINEMAGKFRGKLSSSEEFSRRKADEKKLDR